MSSKLDQMRDQFRERLNLRPIGQTRVHVIKVETNNDNNNNNTETKFAKSGDNSLKNSIPIFRRNLTEKVSTDKLNYSDSKFNANKFKNLNQSSVYPKSEKSVKNDSNDFRKKVFSSHELSKRYQQLSDNKSEKPKDYSFRNKKVFNEKPFESINTEDGMACRYCRRRFALSERLEKHESVCISSLDKSRIKFNSFEQRVKGQPNDYILIYENALKNLPKERLKKSNWKQKHEYCIAAIKAAKGQVSSGPTTSQIMASIQQQCDYCKRRFNEEAIQRHLPICAKLYHKKLLKI